jgi:plastocyanin
MRLITFTFLFITGLFKISAQPLNEFILKEAYKYEGGSYVLSSTGCPEDLIFETDTILKKSKSGTYCSGYTFTLFFKAMMTNQLFEGLTASELKKIQKEWYGIPKESFETQCLFVLEKKKWGKKIHFEEAQPGDFVQFWRNNKSGHSVIFLGWERDSIGQISGLKYRSSQTKTNGIGDRIEVIGQGAKELNRKRIYIARLEKPTTIKSENPFSQEKD